MPSGSKDVPFLVRSTKNCGPRQLHAALRDQVAELYLRILPAEITQEAWGYNIHVMRLQRNATDISCPILSKYYAECDE